MPQNKENKQGPIMRRAAFDSKTIDIEKRTVEVVFATENPVRMWNWSVGEFEEVLSMDPAHVRMERLNAGIPLLDNHNRYAGAKGQLGIVEDATFVNKEGRATLRFSKREDVEPIFQDVKDGILRGISAGYRVYKYEDMNPDRKAGEIPKLRAIDWEPMEVSFAPVQADPRSTVRAEGEDQNEFEIVTTRTDNKSKIMTPEEIKAAEDAQRSAPPAPPAPPVPPVNEEQVRQAATIAERARVKEITDSVRTAGLDEKFATELIEKGTTIDAARKAIIDEWAKKDPNAGQRTSATVTADEGDKRRNAMTDALVLRVMPDVASKPEVMSKDRVEAARSYVGHSLMDMAKDSLTRAGVDLSGLSKMDIVGRAITSSTSDFPVLLEGTNRRILLAAYSNVADTWKRFCMTGSVSDFRANKRLRMGSFSNLDVVGENQEYKTKSIPDAEYETISAKTKGNIINVSRQMIINDDLQGFARLAQMLGRAAARSIESDVYALLLSNSGNGPTMSDGKALFHADHKNIGTGSALGVAGLDADRVLMAQQMDPSNNDYIGITPSVLLVPIGLESSAKVLNSSTYDPDATNKLQKPNVALGMFNDIVGTPRLTGTTRYLFASPSEEPVIEVAFLDGNQSPYLESEQAFTVDGMSWKVRMDYGVGAIGWRGILKNAGA